LLFTGNTDTLYDLMCPEKTRLNDAPLRVFLSSRSHGETFVLVIVFSVLIHTFSDAGHSRQFLEPTEMRNGRAAGLRDSTNRQVPSTGLERSMADDDEPLSYFVPNL